MKDGIFQFRKTSFSLRKTWIPYLERLDDLVVKDSIGDYWAPKT